MSMRIANAPLLLGAATAAQHQATMTASANIATFAESDSFPKLSW
jgi:hypothetical protein